MTPTAKIAFAAIGMAIEREGPAFLPRLTLHYEYQPPGYAQPILRRCRVPAGSPSYAVGDEAVVGFNPASPATSVLLSPRGEPWS